MRLSGWKRLGIASLGAWWLFWIFIFFISRADRDRSIRLDEAVTHEKWTAATFNPQVIEAQVHMNQAILAIVAPLLIGVVIYAVLWIAKGFRKQG